MTDEEVEDYLNFIRLNADNIVAVGEVGLDWHWYPEEINSLNLSHPEKS